MTELERAKARIAELEAQLAARANGEAIMALLEAKKLPKTARAMASAGMTVEDAREALVAAMLDSPVARIISEEEVIRDFYAGDGPIAAHPDRPTARADSDDAKEVERFYAKDHGGSGGTAAFDARAKAKAKSGWAATAARMSAAGPEEL